jgi:signal peptidase II
MGPWGILSLAAAVGLADRLTKALAVDRLPRRTASTGVLRLSINRRLGSGPARSTWGLAAIWIGAVACAGLALAVSPALRAQAIAVAGITAALTGAASNLVDWIRRRAIVDFISIGWWPAFNLADAAIVTGGVLAGLSLA